MRLGLVLRLVFQTDPRSRWRLPNGYACLTPNLAALLARRSAIACFRAHSPPAGVRSGLQGRRATGRKGKVSQGGSHPRRWNPASPQPTQPSIIPARPFAPGTSANLYAIANLATQT